jgi:hypothetical protein
VWKKPFKQRPIGGQSVASAKKPCQWVYRSSQCAQQSDHAKRNISHTLDRSHLLALPHHIVSFSTGVAPTNAYLHYFITLLIFSLSFSRGVLCLLLKHSTYKVPSYSVQVLHFLCWREKITRLGMTFSRAADANVLGVGSSFKYYIVGGRNYGTLCSRRAFSKLIICRKKLYYLRLFIK